MKMQKIGNKTFRYINLAGQLTTTLIVSLLLGIFLGLYVDKIFTSSPVFTIVFSFFGIFSGLKTVVKMCLDLEKNLD